MAVNTGIPKGTRDFSPGEMVRRNLIFDTVRDVFRLYGFQPIETPAMENLSTLLGKYGEEGDRLIFKILNSGDYLSDVDLTDIGLSASRLTPKISEKALRYDLTVPFARYVVQHRADIQFPFRRYQIQPVWRADRPQKGRYREFYQCDVDVIGSDSLLCEAELIHIIDDVFTRLGIRVSVHVNNRKVLAGLAEITGCSDKFTDMTVAMDKLEKIGAESMAEELRQKGFTDDAIDKVLMVAGLSGTNSEKSDSLKTLLTGSEAGLKGIEELETMLAYTATRQMDAEVVFSPALARGLNYYTGAIVEVKARDLQFGSICGGGRYDDLTGIFGLPGVSGVGVSFGADRVYDVMRELNLFPDVSVHQTKVMFVNFGGEEEQYSLRMLDQLRRAGIHSEMYPEAAKVKKQFAYAGSRNIPYVAVTGSEELQSGTVSLKNMQTGEQVSLTPGQLQEHLG
jgi:histidyl-tRNA synthetase